VKNGSFHEVNQIEQSEKSEQGKRCPTAYTGIQIRKNPLCGWSAAQSPTLANVTRNSFSENVGEIAFAGDGTTEEATFVVEGVDIKLEVLDQVGAHGQPPVSGGDVQNPTAAVARDRALHRLPQATLAAVQRPRRPYHAHPQNERRGEFKSASKRRSRGGAA
jgi:hypothetical protein